MKAKANLLRLKINLSVNIAGISMKNPVMPASGTFGYGEEYSQLIDISRLGAVVTKGTTFNPREGNPQPRIYETASGIINCIGLQNPGIEEVIREKIPFLRQFGVPIIVNIAGETIEEYEYLVKRLDQASSKGNIAGLEVNVSCPNIKEGGMAFGQDPKILSKLIGKVRKKTSLPLIVKLTPNVTDITSIAQSAVEAGADALSLINTIKARAKIRRGPQVGKWIEGGFSGPAIKPIALRMVSEVAKANLGVPIIGIGGIMNTEDALDFFEVGATAIAIGTANFINPKVMEEMIKGLKKYLIDNKITDINHLIEKKKGGVKNEGKR